jgi:hypothetical protein
LQRSLESRGPRSLIAISLWVLVGGSEPRLRDDGHQRAVGLPLVQRTRPPGNPRRLRILQLSLRHLHGGDSTDPHTAILLELTPPPPPSITTTTTTTTIHHHRLQSPPPITTPPQPQSITTTTTTTIHHHRLQSPPPITTTTTTIHHHHHHQPVTINPT